MTRGPTLARVARSARAVCIAPAPAAQLALLRIVVPAMILWCPETRRAPALAAVPRALWRVPEGLGWFAAVVPIDPLLAHIAQGACVGAALCAMAGVRARLACAVLTASAFYLFALNQLAGAVWHDMHLLWVAALLAVSPCDDALVPFDPRERAAPPPDSTRYGWPLAVVRALLACVYFFPGLHKLHTSGLAWALSDNLRHQLWWKWAEHGVEPSWRPDRVPGLLELGGLWVLAFELGFPLLAFGRRTRSAAAVMGLVFHATAGVLLRIPFVSLWALYIALIEPATLRRWGARWRRAGRTSVAPARAEVAPGAPIGARRAGAIVGALLVLAAAVQGARGQMRAYPFACYPTFEWIVGTEMPDLEIELQDARGQRTRLAHARDRRGYRTQRQWGEIWSLAGVTAPVEPARLRAYVREIARHDPAARARLATAVRVRFYRAFVSVVPEERRRPPRRGALLSELSP